MYLYTDELNELVKQFKEREPRATGVSIMYDRNHFYVCGSAMDDTHDDSATFLLFKARITTGINANGLCASLDDIITKYHTVPLDNHNEG